MRDWLKSLSCGAMFVKTNDSSFARCASSRVPQSRSARRAMCPRSSGLSAYSSSPTWLRGLVRLVEPEVDRRAESCRRPLPSTFHATQRQNRRAALMASEKWV